MRSAAFALVLVVVFGCKTRREVERTPEDRALVRKPAKFAVVERGAHDRGFFFGNAYVTLGREPQAFDLGSYEKRRVLEKMPPLDVDERFTCAADATQILCLHERAMFMDAYLLDALDGEAKKLEPRIPGHAPDVRVDGTDWYLRRTADTFGPTEWGEILGISRPKGNRRSVASSPEMLAFDVDDDFVYWIDGRLDAKIVRKKKLGGPTETVTSVPGAGEVFVRGAFVHHRSGGVIRRATKTGGALEETSVAGVDQLAFDESGFCWCSIDKEPKVFCRGADDASRPLQLEAKSKCDWIAISRANVVIQAGAALWVAGRP